MDERLTADLYAGSNPGGCSAVLLPRMGEGSSNALNWVIRWEDVLILKSEPNE
jgi:hypothetical protein